MEFYLSCYFHRYVPSFIPPPLAAKGKESEKKEEERMKDKEKVKSRNIDHFMEKLKHEQEMRERRNLECEPGRDGHHSDGSAPSSRFGELPDDFGPSGKLPGSLDGSDPQTTNLYVGNLSPKVDENFLLRTFGRFGPIASVKIMWPRTEEEQRGQRNCGFVAFMNRADGKAAKDEMQGVRRLVVFFCTKNLKLTRTMALYVLDGGCDFEQAIMERGRGNPLFNFLFELGSKEHTYYIWRLYSFAQVHCLNASSYVVSGAITMICYALVYIAPVKNASAYRTKFEATLPDIMESFNDLYRSVTGRITAEALKERVLKVLQAWSNWFLFSDAYMNGLRATFLRSGNSGVSPFHSICGDAPEIEKSYSTEDTVDGIKANQDSVLAMGKGAAMKELMDLPLAELERRCRHNGLSLVGGREIMVARLLSLEDAEKQRAEAMGLSGRTRYAEVRPLHNAKGLYQPELKAFTKKEKIDPVLPASKWTREDNDSDDEEKRSSKGLGWSYSSSGSENGGDGPSKADELDFGNEFLTLLLHVYNTHRQKLRRLEVALIEYRESLEEQGIKNAEDIEERVVVHRKRLESEHGLSDTIEDVSGRSYFAERTSKEMMRMTLQESGIEVKAKVRALQGNHQTEAGIEYTIQKRTVKGTEKDIMVCKMKGVEIGSVGERVKSSAIRNLFSDGARNARIPSGTDNEKKIWLFEHLVVKCLIVIDDFGGLFCGGNWDTSMYNVAWFHYVYMLHNF
ncbi:hypothetical protein GQ457_16G000380 [Hibiscus cannabinus]